MQYGMVAHGGAGGTSSIQEEGCRQVVTLGMEILRQGGSSLDAVVIAVKWMEDSGEFNAGTGAFLRIDGSMEMEAVIATSRGLQRTAEVMSGIKNPVLVALELVNTDLRRIAGPGATQFAIERGLEIHPGPTERARKRLQQLRQKTRESLARGEIPPGWTAEELRPYLESNGSEGDYPDLLLPATQPQHDTVGAIALDKEGVFALAASTGGSGLMRRGRGGDVPVQGAGFEIGEKGTVLATGVGEAIIDVKGADVVFRLIGMSFTPEQACQQTLSRFVSGTGDIIPVGFIALTREAVGIAANCPMASHFITE